MPKSRKRNPTPPLLPRELPPPRGILTLADLLDLQPDWGQDTIQQRAEMVRRILAGEKTDVRSLRSALKKSFEAVTRRKRKILNRLTPDHHKQGRHGKRALMEEVLTDPEFLVILYWFSSAIIMNRMPWKLYKKTAWYIHHTIKDLPPCDTLGLPDPNVSPVVVIDPTLKHELHRASKGKAKPNRLGRGRAGRKGGDRA